MEFKCIVTRDNVHIVNSYLMRKAHFADLLTLLNFQHPDCEVFKHRSIASMKLEWAVHNFCYNINYKRSSTKDVDINYPSDKPLWVYHLVGVLVWLFIK